METIDEEVTKATLDYLDKAKKENRPFFLWWNSTRMHINTHLKPESVGKTGLGVYPDGMVEHDAMVGQILDKLKALGLEENTIVMYSTDNGAEEFTWPDGGTTPFRGEKNTNWEGGYRVPTVIRWPGVIKPGTISNDLFAHEDMLPTLMAAAGVADVKAQLLKGMNVGGKTFKVHLDGYNITDALAGKGPSPRHEFFYFNDDGSLVALRYDHGRSSSPSSEHRLRRLAGAVRAIAFAEIFNLRSIPSRRPISSASVTNAGGSTAPSSWCRRSSTSRIPRDVQGVSAEPEGWQLQPRPGARNASAERWTVGRLDILYAGATTDR